MMKTNKILTGLTLMLSALLFQSCLKDQEDVFDESSAARMENYLNEAQRVLMSSENGWVLEYYPETHRKYGGFTYTLKFTKDEAEVRSEINPDAKETCLYAMKTNNGPELSFDTYSPMMHFFATPSSELNEAYGGDFEFVIDSIGQDAIKFHGKRSQNVMYMRRLKESAAAYQKKVVDVGDNFNLIGSDGTISGKKAHFEYDVVARQLTIITDTDTLETAYNYTENGLRLYEPLMVNGVSVSELTYSKEKLSLAADKVDLAKGWQNPQTVVDEIKSIGSDDEAFSRTYRNIDNLGEFKFVTGADWVNVTTNGNDLTVSMTPNTTGDVRSAEVFVVNGNYHSSFVVTQCEVGDVTGNYAFIYKDNKGNEKVTKASLSASGKGMKFAFMDPEDKKTYSIPVAFDQATGSLRIQGGNLGKFNSTYYMIGVLLFGGGSQGTWDPRAYMSAPFQHDEKNGTYAIFGGKVNDYPIEGLLLFASEIETPKSLSDMAGFLFWFESPIIVKLKNKDQPAKSFYGLEERMPQVKRSSIPASIKMIEK